MGDAETLERVREFWTLWGMTDEADVDLLALWEDLGRILGVEGMS